MRHGHRTERLAPRPNLTSRLRLNLRAACVLPFALAGFGCVGDIGASDGEEGTTPTDPGAPPSSNNGTLPPETSPVPPPMVAAPGTCGAPMFSTPLTREQYINTVNDLLGVDVRATVSFTDASGRKYSPELKRSALEAEGFIRTARTIADQAVTTASLPKLAPCGQGKDESKCADDFIAKFGARAFRRPLSSEQRADLRALYDAGRADGGFATGVKWVVEGLLQSPEFLYHLVTPAGSAKAGTVVQLDNFELADRLSYFLWNSGPDEILWQAAEQGKLHDREVLAEQIQRMRKDPRAARTREDFYRGLLSLDIVGELTRDDAAYTPELAKSLEKSALSAIHDVYANDGKSDTLLGSQTVFVDPTMAKVYGNGTGGSGTGTDMRPATYGKKERFGILTHPALMATIAEHDTSDPIHRGTFVYTKILCQSIPSPPDAVPALPTLSPGLTTRQRLEEHRSAPACSGCHAAFDPIGLAFENFDSLGRYRADERGAKVDSSGEIKQSDIDVSGPFADGFELFEKMAKSKTVRGCFAQQWYEYATRRETKDADKCGLDAVRTRFLATGDLNDLLGSIALADNFRNRTVTE